MSKHTPEQAEAIENSNAHLSNAGLPSYTDLLEAIRRMLPQYEALLKDCGLTSAETIDTARSAISKAEGR